MTIFKQIPSLSSLLLFDAIYPCHFIGDTKLLTGKSFKLPNMEEYLDGEEFAEVVIGWNEEKIQLRIEIDVPFEKANLNDYRKVDSVELFFDTRNLKQKTTLGRFCHHFVFFAEPVEGALAHEITRFRGDDIHTLCRAADLLVEPIVKLKYTILNITIPSECLHGYNPTDFPEIGFSYRINRKGGEPQSFSVSSKEVFVEKNPSLWSTLELKK